MKLQDVLAEAQSGQAVPRMADAFGISEDQARTVLDVVTRELANGIERNTLSRGGLADLVAALGEPQHAARLDDPEMFGDEAARADGNAILGHILGGRDGSRRVAAQAAQAAGLSDSLVKMLLPYIASMVMAALARMLKGGLGDIMNRIPMPGGGHEDEAPRRPSRRSPSDGGGEPYGRGFELPRGGIDRPDSDAGGWRQDRAPAEPRDEEEVPRRAPQGGGIPRQSPLPLPGERPLPDQEAPAENPYGDLTDILRRRGAPSIDGGSLWSVVRNMLGGALGFGNRGVVGWLINLIIVRFGWGILRRILGRLLLGR